MLFLKFCITCKCDCPKYWILNSVVFCCKTHVSFWSVYMRVNGFRITHALRFEHLVSYLPSIGWSIPFSSTTIYLITAKIFKSFLNFCFKIDLCRLICNLTFNLICGCKFYIFSVYIFLYVKDGFSLFFFRDLFKSI